MASSTASVLHRARPARATALVKLYHLVARATPCVFLTRERSAATFLTEEGEKLHEVASQAVGGLFQMSTAQRHSPSGSLRQIVTARPAVVEGLPSAPFIVTEFSLNM
jgi:hypothetical protein